MSTFARLSLLLFLLCTSVLSVGCIDNITPFKRKPLKPEQDTTEWRYFHNYKMYMHEHRVIEEHLEGGGRFQTSASWIRLKEYLIGMKDNMPSEKSFEFVVIMDKYDEAMKRYLEENKSSMGALRRIRRLHYTVRREYDPEDIYPDYDPYEE